MLACENYLRLILRRKTRANLDDLFSFNFFQFGPGELGMVRSYYARDNKDYEEVNSQDQSCNNAFSKLLYIGKTKRF